MHLVIQRDFVCAADDFDNDSRLELDVADESTVKDLLAHVMSLDYLQYSSSQRCMVARSGRSLALVIPEFHEAIYVIDPATPLRDCVIEGKLDFSFDLSREEEYLFGQYWRKKLFG